MELEKRLLAGEKTFSEREIRDLLEYEVETIEGDEGRWTRDIETIIEVNGRLFSINWKRGLTEYQEDSYDYQPVEVERYEETVVVTKYRLK